MKFQLDHTIKILNRTPAVIEDLLYGLPKEWIHNNEGPDTWSPFDIVGHLVHGEKTDWIPRALIILGDRTDKTFVPFDRFAQFEDSKGKTIHDLLDEFRALRDDNIVTLKSWDLKDSDLTKTGQHPALGTVMLKELLSTWAVHDLNHIYQMSRVLANNYKEEVGVWRAYLGVLK